MHARAQKRARTHTRTHAQTHARTNARTHRRTHAQTHARSDARTRARAHAPTQFVVEPLLPLLDVTLLQGLTLCASFISGILGHTAANYTLKSISPLVSLLHHTSHITHHASCIANLSKIYRASRVML